MNRMKPIGILLAAALMCGCAGCGTQEDTTSQSKAHMQGAYDSLCTATARLSEIGDAIQAAWHYGIYEDDPTVSGLASKTGISKADLTEAGAFDYMLGQGFSYCVGYAKAAMESNGDYQDAKDAIDKAKAEIQKVTDDLDYFSDMKNFYSSCLAYYEWLQAPDGNFNQATDTINDYEKELQEFKNDMAFDYG